MQKKQMRLMITFQNTVDAMRMETVCKEIQAPGRLIPVPREITAGCGLCFMTKPEEEENMEQIMKQNKIIYEKKINMFF